MVASKEGECKCGSSSFDVSGRCIDSAAFAAVGSVGGFLLLLALVFIYYEYKHRQADEMWKVDIEELHFSDPVEIIGQGSYGVVLVAEYRGTKVAIKQAVRGKPGSSGKEGGLVDATSHERRDLSSSMNSLRSSSKVAPSCDSDRLGGADGPTEEFSDETPMNDDVMNDDVEIGHPSPGYKRRNSAGVSRRYDGGTLDFLGGFMRGGRFSWRKDDNYLRRFNEIILGTTSTSKSSTRRSLHELCCPWFNEQAQRKRGFIAEMRVLSLLRHPCITTGTYGWYFFGSLYAPPTLTSLFHIVMFSPPVMGAVMTKSSPPMMVMEYMDYGSLYDLLRNETMYLTGEIISQIVRSVSSYGESNPFH